jgi:hypothetical protein
VRAGGRRLFYGPLPVGSLRAAKVDRLLQHARSVKAFPDRVIDVAWLGAVADRDDFSPLRFQRIAERQVALVPQRRLELIDQVPEYPWISMASTPASFAIAAAMANDIMISPISSVVSERVDTLGSRKHGTSDAEIGAIGLPSR